MRAKQIRELVGIVEESNIDELEVTKWWGLKVRIRKNTGAVAVQPPVNEYVVHAAPSTTPAPLPPVPLPAEFLAVPDDTTVPVNVNYVETKAPMVGTFYRASSPDVEPFAKEGDVVSKGQVLCIIEAMKLMNEIEADTSGRIVKILADNAQPIEYNQPLFLIDPS